MRALKTLSEHTGTHTLFDPESADADEEALFDLPAAERVSKHGFFQCYRVLRVEIPPVIEGSLEDGIQVSCVEDGESGDYDTFSVSALSPRDLFLLVDRVCEIKSKSLNQKGDE